MSAISRMAIRNIRPICIDLQVINRVSLTFFRTEFPCANIVKVERQVESLFSNYSVKREQNEFTRYAERGNRLIFSELARNASYIVQI